jgi:acetyl-CoA carboxylase carboxyltransferase component
MKSYDNKEMVMGGNKISAYDRLLAFFDEGSVEVIYNESVVAGRGSVDGRSVYAYAQDFTQNAGAMTEDMADMICEVMDMALKDMVPLISINECGCPYSGGRQISGWLRKNPAEKYICLRSNSSDFCCIRPLRRRGSLFACSD